MRCVSPLEAVARGLVGGLAGSLAINAFFKATAKVAPKEQGEFEPPEERQRGEMPPATVARRTVEGLARRGPLTDEQVARGGSLVHYAYGAGWGVLYGILAESVPALKSPLGGALFGTGVGLASGAAILPGFRLGPGPRATPAKAQAYQLAAHAVYGAAVWGGYRALAPEPYVAAATYVGLRGRSRRQLMRARIRGKKALVKTGARVGRGALSSAGTAARSDVGRRLLGTAVGTVLLARYPFARRVVGGAVTARILADAAKSRRGRKILKGFAGTKVLKTRTGRKAAGKYVKAKGAAAVARSRAGRKAARKYVESRF